MTVNENELAGRPHALYRFFAGDELLYVGITCDIGARWERHSDDKPWWGEVSRSTVEQFHDRASVLEAERAAIRDEGPKYNIRGRLPARPGKSAKERAMPSAKDKPSRSDRLIAVERAEFQPDSLVGSFFLSDWRHGWQGCVVGEPAPGVYLCELFSWLMGESSTQVLVRLEEMSGWRFFDDAAWMRDDYDRTTSKRWELDRKKAEQEARERS